MSWLAQHSQPWSHSLWVMAPLRIGTNSNKALNGWVFKLHTISLNRGHCGPKAHHDQQDEWCCPQFLLHSASHGSLMTMPGMRPLQLEVDTAWHVLVQLYRIGWLAYTIVCSCSGLVCLEHSHKTTKWSIACIAAPEQGCCWTPGTACPPGIWEIGSSHDHPCIPMSPHEQLC